MGRACSWAVWGLFPVAVAVFGPAPRAAAGEPVPMKIGLPESMFSGLPSAVVQRAARPFQTMIEKQAGLKGEVVVGRDYVDLADQLRSGKLDVAVLHGFEYAWVKQHPELLPLVVTVPGNKIQACIVVNAESKVQSPQGLKGETVAIPGNTKAHCHLYLARLRGTLPDGTCGQYKLKGKTVEEALDAVSDDQCPAALVDVAALTAYQKLKPGAGSQLRILVVSETFPSAVVVYRKDAFPQGTARKLQDGLVNCVNTIEGEQLTSLWRLKGFETAGPAYQAELDKCLKSYPAPEKK
ncbi:MAG: phosphate/phosphite/phosphonate ABC transporter substrate-binding protein [Gemmata sp.]